jgi:hypothetical protein
VQIIVVVVVVLSNNCDWLRRFGGTLKCEEREKIKKRGRRGMKK